MLRPPADNSSIKILDSAIDDSTIRAVLTLPDAHILKDDADRSVIKTALADGSPIIVKCRRFRGFSSFVRRTFRHSPLQNEIRGLRTLARLNIPTSVPLAYIRGSTCEAIVLRYIPGPTLFEVLAGPPLTVAREQALCRAVAVEICTLLRAGYFNRDSKPSNLIVVGDFSNPAISIIDAAGIKSSQGHTFALRLMLASLYIEPRGTKNTVRNALCMRMLHATVRELGASSQDARRDAHNLWRVVQNHIEYHGDPRPTHDPMIIPSPGI